MSRTPIAVIVLAFVLALTACAGGRDDIAGPGSTPQELSGFTLPAPAALKLPAYAETDLTMLGKDFLPAYTNARVQAQDNSAVFLPAYDPAAPDLNDLAYAIYSISAPGFDRDSNLLITWEISAEFSSGWVGLANYNSNSWDWYPLPASNTLPFDLTNNFSLGSEQLIVAFVFGGTDVWKLERFRLGAVPPPPPAPLNVQATDGTLNDRIRVTWEKTATAVEYLIYRDDTAAPLATVGDVSTYYDTDVDDPDAHRYWVQGQNEGGAGELSVSDVGWRGQSPGGPTPPGFVVATDGDYPDRIKVFWFRSLGAQHYEVFRDDMFTPIVTVDDVTVYWDYGVSDGAVHTYWVRAINNFGTSAFSPSDTGFLNTDPQGPGDWAMYGRDKSHSCHSPNTGPLTNDLLWACDLSVLAGVNVKCGYSSPVLSVGGVIYISSDRGYLFAIKPDGTEKWHTQVPGLNLHTPAIGSDGTIYLASGGNTLHAITPFGDPEWTYTASNPAALLTGPVAVDAAGTVYVAAANSGEVYAVDSTGTLVTGWPFAIQDAPALVFPALSPDGQTVYGGAGAVLGTVYFNAINLDGSEAWHITHASGADASPSVDSLGNIYYAPTGSLISLKPDGSGENWSFAAEHLYGCVGIDELNSALYFGTNTAIGDEDGHFAKYGTDSSFVWENEQLRGAVGAPAIDSQGHVYYGARDGYVYAYASDQSLLWSYNVGSEIWSSPAVASGGILYIGAEDGKLYAFGPTT